MIYEALGETEQAEAIVEEAIDIFPPSAPPAFIDELDVLREEANQRAEGEERLALGEDYNLDTEVNDSDLLWSYVPSYSDVISTSSIQETPSVSNNQKESLDSTISGDDQKLSLLPINERPEVDKEDLLDNEKDNQLASSLNRIEANSDIIPNNIQSNTKTDFYDFPKRETSFLPNTPYKVIAEIGSLDLAPIALNNDCWILKKDNKFKFLFPDGSIKNLEEEHLILQIDPNSLNTTPTLSSACLISKTKKSNQYYPKEEVTSCLSEKYEKTFYSLEGNYQESKAPILVRSSKQPGYWIYNPAYEVLFGPFEDSEDTSFYSKMSRLSNITLSGHHGEIGGPYWTTAQSLDQEKNNSSTSTQEAQIWSKDGKSYKTGYTNPRVIDWYTVGAFQGNQFHLLDEDLNVVYAGSFDQGGSVIDSKAPIQIGGVWKLVCFENIQKNSGPITNYSFINTDKKEKSENSSYIATSEPKKKESSEKTINKKSNSEENKKTDLTSEKTVNSTHSSKSYEENKTKEQIDKTDSNPETKNTSDKLNDEKTTIDTQKSSLNSSIKKVDSSASLTQGKENDLSKIDSSTPIYYSFPEFFGTYTVTGPNWRNSFKLHSNGSFEGEYTQFFETEKSEMYPNGKAKVCGYSGTFSLKNNRLKITNLSLELEVEKTWIEKGILYQSIGLSESCMAQGDTFTLYGPGTPYSEFSPKASRWIPASTKSITTDFIMVQDGSSEYAYI